MEQKHSDRGIMSFIIWVVTLIFWISWWLFGLGAMIQRSIADENGLYVIAQYKGILRFIGFGCVGLNTAGLVLGISGLRQANCKRHFSAFGAALNGLGIWMAQTLVFPSMSSALHLLMEIGMLIGTGIWVFFDAERIGVKKTDEKAFLNMGPIGWAICTWFFWAITFPLYLIKRPEFQRKFQPADQPLASLAASHVAVAPVAEGWDIDQQLRKLAKLKEDGIISQEEFDQKKKTLLGL